ncbi:MAG: alpha/beta hydrolase [Planctomycetes bacterium]|nr:alpha/beta hydrolase [Planctomycetota bacterium]
MFRIMGGLLCAALGLSLITASWAQDKKTDKKDDKKTDKKVEKKKPPMPSQPPTHAAVAYGKHPRQVLDFYQAVSFKPTPVVFYIHGGGWRGGDKNSVGNVKPYLDAGISVVAINYRYTQNGEEDNVVPPVKAPLEDAARALQFVRSKAYEWNIDKKRIGATGGSAGACSSLWLAFHNDMANPKSSDPIARESTRLWCAAVNGAQTSLDPKELKEWLPNYTYGAHAFGLKSFDELHEKRESVLKWIKEYSPIEHTTKDDPPIGLFYGGDKDAKVGGIHKDPTHSPVMGMKLKEKLDSLGVPVAFAYAGHPDAKYSNAQAFLIERLKSAVPPTVATEQPQARPIEQPMPGMRRPLFGGRRPLQRILDAIRLRR